MYFHSLSLPDALPIFIVVFGVDGAASGPATRFSKGTLPTDRCGIDRRIGDDPGRLGRAQHDFSTADAGRNIGGNDRWSLFIVALETMSISVLRPDLADPSLRQAPGSPTKEVFHVPVLSSRSEGQTSELQSLIRI